MTGSNDDPDVTAFFRRGDSSPTDPQDAELMRAAADMLRPLTAGRPPMPSQELSALMAAGTTWSRSMLRTRVRAALTRFAGLGAAAKVMLAASVAVAGAGGAAAVAYSTGHLDSHHSSHGAGHPRHSAHPSPEPTDRHGATNTPGSDNATPEPTASSETEPGDDHPGPHRGRGGSGDGSSQAPGGGVRR